MKKPWRVSITCLVLAALLMALGYRGNAPIPERERTFVALLTEDRGTDAMQFKQGAQAAADELGARLIVMAAKEGLPVSEQLHSFLAELTDTAFDGLILPEASASVKARATRLANQRNVPTVYYDVGAAAGLCVRTDHEKLGELLARAARSDLSGEEANYYVLTSGTLPEEEMLLGITAVLGFEPNKIHSITRAFDGIPLGSVLFVLRSDTTLTIASASAGRYRVWGVDPGDARVRLLEDGYARGYAMTSPFAVGYQSVFLAAANYLGDELTIAVPGKVVTQENMYDSENIKLMFPLLQ